MRRALLTFFSLAALVTPAAAQISSAPNAIPGMEANPFPVINLPSQRDDGSWPMTSRPVKPGGEGSKSLIPITGAGSAWAVLGLVRSR